MHEEEEEKKRKRSKTRSLRRRNVRGERRRISRKINERKICKMTRRRRRRWRKRKKGRGGLRGVEEKNNEVMSERDSRIKERFE